MYIEVNGIRMFYRVSGNGPAIVLVHGNGEDHRIFHETAELLERDYTVYALDSRGHGKSSGGDAFGYEAMAEDVAAFIRACKLKSPLYCGFSDGGIIGMLAAIKYPDIFSKMVICGANTEPRGLKGFWLMFFTLMEKLRPDPRTRMMLVEPHITGAQLGRISIPVLVVAGEKDLIREDQTRYLASKIKNSYLKILPGEGHGTYIVHSRKLYHVMKKFLKK
ncbi:MAG: alpha/beta hydrolase [Lacrimispora sp.]|uniref:alpha/beta fold hydrolase n=1 Tax=Lacrimispora sp. TaxID=2719234 RepID=UPI0039E472DA